MARLGTTALVAVASVATLLRRSLGDAGEGFVVVVNQANPLDRLSRAEISRLFLKRTAAWPDGAAAAPCDLSGTSPTRKAFSQGVHGKPVWVVVAFWQQEIASGRSQPPAVCPSEQAALQAVRDNPGGGRVRLRGHRTRPRTQVARPRAVASRGERRAELPEQGPAISFERGAVHARQHSRLELGKPSHDRTRITDRRVGEGLSHRLAWLPDRRAGLGSGPARDRRRAG